MDGTAPLTAESGEQVGFDGVAETLLLSPAMQVEQSDGQAVTLYLRNDGTRIRVPLALHRLLLAFETPRSLVSVAQGDARVASAIARLRDKGFLVREGEAGRVSPQRLTTDPPIRLFDCPAHKLAPSNTDVVVLGVPYDLSDCDAAGARQGPSALRETSLQLLYGIDRHGGRPHGWFDADLGRPTLRGVTIGDCGDVFVDPGEPQARLFARITEILTRVTERGNLPLLLGGDAAISFPAIALLQARQPLAVIRIGGVAPAEAPGSFVSPSSLQAHVLGLPQVSRYVQVGAEAATFRREGLAALERDLGDGARVYVGLDLSALVQPGEGSDSHGFTYAELHALLRAIGARYTIAGLDLVGANPQKPGWRATAMTAVHLLLTGLSAATRS